jgi:hypothetical protein
LKKIEKEERGLEELEAIFVKRLPKGKGKYEVKSSFKCFSCNKIGYFSSKCREIFSKYKPKYDKRYYCVDEGVTNHESDKGGSSDNEWVFISTKEDDPKPIDSTSSMNVEKSLVAQIEEKNEWVIDSGCSHHMIGDKRNFVSMENYEGGVVRFGDDKYGIIHGRGSISLDGKHNTNDFLYVEGLKHNLLSIG